jgi:mRNA-degrading endonuclease HigB of HigAB toxin-antitoxin module
MQVIGLPILFAYADRHPAAAPDLRAFVALIQAAAWPTAQDLLRSWSAVARCDDSERVRIDLADAGCAVVLQVSYPHQLMRIETVLPLTAHQETAIEPERRRRTPHPIPGRL